MDFKVEGDRTVFRGGVFLTGRLGDIKAIKTDLDSNKISDQSRKVIKKEIERQATYILDRIGEEYGISDFAIPRIDHVHYRTSNGVVYMSLHANTASVNMFPTGEDLSMRLFVGGDIRHNRTLRNLMMLHSSLTGRYSIEPSEVQGNGEVFLLNPATEFPFFVEGKNQLKKRLSEFDPDGKLEYSVRNMAKQRGDDLSRSIQRGEYAQRFLEMLGVGSEAYSSD